MSDWIWEMNGKPEGPEKEADRAIVRNLGSTHVPMLLQWLQEEDTPSLTERLDNVRHSIFFWLVGHKIIPNRSIGSLRDHNLSRRALATWALPELEPEAKKQAISSLIQLFKLRKPNSEEPPDSACAAAYVLSKMTPESIPLLINNLTNQDYLTWGLTAASLQMSGPEAKSAAPFIERRLHDPDPRIRSIAADSILSLGGDPAKYVPVIIGTLGDYRASDPDDFAYAIEILLKHREQAKLAIPILIDISNTTTNKTDPTNSMIRDATTRALEVLQNQRAAD